MKTLTTKQTKVYNKAIQQNYGQGWETVDTYRSERKLKQDLQNYKALKYPTRVINN